MADNKKKKVSFAESLKAQADKLVPSKADDNEVINVDLDGVQVPVARGKGKDRLSDAEWEQVKKRAAQPVEDADPKAKEHSWGDIMSLAQDVKGRAKGLVSPEEAQLLEKTNEWDRAEFLRQRMKNKGYKVPINSAQDERDSIRGEKTLPAEKPAAPYLSNEDQKKQTEEYKKNKGKLSDETPVQTPTEAQGTPDEWAPMPGAKPEVSSAGPGMSPLANAQQMMMGAAPKNIVTSSLAEVGNDALNKVAPMEGGFPGASNPAPMTGGFPGASNPAPMEGGFPGLPEMKGAPTGAVSPINFDGTAPAAPAGKSPINFDQPGGGDNPVTRILAPDQGAWPGAITNEQAAGLPPSPNAAGAPAPMPAPETTPAGGGGSVSESASLNIPGGFSPVGPDPAAMKQFREDAANARSAAEDAQFTIAAQGEAQKTAIRDAAAKEMMVQEEAANLSKLSTEAKMTSVNEARRYETARMKVVEQAQQAAADPINPNRYWNNKDDGQRAAAIIAGALFGFTGQGMQWLQRIDGLVNADNQLQASDRAAKVAGLNQQAQALGEAGQAALRNGATEAEAHLIERQAKLEGLKSYLDMTTMKLSNAQQQMMGAQMSAQLGQHIAGLGMQGAQLAQQQADSLNQTRYQNAQLAQQKFAVQAKVAAAKGGSGLKIPQAQQGIISAAEAGLGMLPELEKAIGNPDGSIPVALWDQVMKGVPGSDANNRKISTAFLNRAIFAGIDKSVINKADQDFLDELQAGVGLSSLRKKGAITALRRMLNESKAAAIRTARSLDQNVGDLGAGASQGDDFGFEAMQ